MDSRGNLQSCACEGAYLWIMDKGERTINAKEVVTTNKKGTPPEPRNPLMQWCPYTGAAVPAKQGAEG